MSEIALVTGTSAGFGKAITERLVSDGYRVIANARRLEKLQSPQAALGERNVYPLQMDTSQTQAIDEALVSLPKEWREIDILANNAGLALGLDKAYEADSSDWLTTINTNIVGLTYLTRQILPDMVKRNTSMIINLGSTVGTIPYPGADVYGASRAFVKQFSLNSCANLAGTKIRAINVEPGLCEGTEFSNVRFEGDNERAKKLYDGAHAIKPEDIVNTTSWVANQPSHVNINRIETVPVSQSFKPQPVYRD